MILHALFYQNSLSPKTLALFHIACTGAKSGRVESDESALRWRNLSFLFLCSLSQDIFFLKNDNIPDLEPKKVTRYLWTTPHTCMWEPYRTNLSAKSITAFIEKNVSFYLFFCLKGWAFSMKRNHEPCMSFSSGFT